MREAVRMPEWKLDGGATYVVTGVPVLAGDLTDELAGSTLRLLLVAVAVMALVLALLFRARLRLLPLAIALGAVAIVFGAAVGARAAADDGVDRGAAGAARPGRRLRDPVPGGRRSAAVPRSRRRRWPPAVGFLILLLSPVPMVRGFGALLVAGVGVALVLALTAGTAVLTLAARRRTADGALARSLRGAGELVDGARRGGSRALAPAAAAGAGHARRWRSAIPGAC